MIEPLNALENQARAYVKVEKMIGADGTNERKELSQIIFRIRIQKHYFQIAKLCIDFRNDINHEN